MPAMAFAIRNLSVLAYANGFTLWHYKAGTDRLDDVAASNFFAEASGDVVAGDLVMVSAADGARILVLAPAQAGVVETASLA
jgi:hypothetical protein